MKSAQVLSIFNEHRIQLFGNQSFQIHKKLRDVIKEICKIEGEAFQISQNYTNEVIQESRADIEWLKDEFQIFFNTDSALEGVETNYVSDDNMILECDEFSKRSLALLKKIKQLIK